MEELRSIYKDFSQSFAERMRNPFAGAFILSYFSVNWPILVYLIFGNDGSGSETRVQLIANYLLSAGLLYTLGGPLLLAILLLLAMPWIAFATRWYCSEPQVKQRELKIDEQIRVQGKRAKLAEVKLEAEKKTILIELMRSDEVVQELTKERDQLESAQKLATMDAAAQKVTIDTLQQALDEERIRRKDDREELEWRRHWHVQTSEQAARMTSMIGEKLEQAIDGENIGKIGRSYIREIQDQARLLAIAIDKPMKSRSISSSGFFRGDSDDHVSGSAG